MNPDLPAVKIQMLKGSLRCLIFGLLGLLPVVGLPFALAALWLSGQVRVKEKLFWNAARPHRIAGVVCAAAGTLLWFLVIVLMVYNSASSGHGGTYGLSGDE